MIDLAKKISISNSDTERTSLEVLSPVLFSSETMIKAERKISIDTEYTADLTFHSSSSQDDNYDKIMQWFSTRGIKEGSPEELTSSVAISNRKQISQLKTKSHSTSENNGKSTKKKLTLSISL